MNYKIELHKFDVLVIGSGGAGLNAAQVASQFCKTAVISKVYPTRSHTISAQGGISAALGNLEEDKWIWHMFDTVKGSDYLADQDSAEYMTKMAPEMIIELEHIGVPFSRTPEGKIAQRPFGGHTAEFGKRPVKRACYAADRTGHAMLQTLYEKSIEQGTFFFNEFYCLDLILTDNAVNGVLCFDIQNGEFHLFNAKAIILATGGSCRVYKTTSNAHINTGDGIALAMKAGISWSDAEFVQFHPTGIYGAGNLITEGVRGEGGYLINSKNERFMERYTPTIKDLAPRDIVSRCIAKEILEGRGCGDKKDYVLLKIDHIGHDAIMEKLPGIHELALIFSGVDCTKEPIPVCPTAHYQNGGIPTNYLSNVLDGSNDKIINGLFAAGECAAASVHGANRLGTNSLLDLVVFGRTAGREAAKYAEKNNFIDLPENAAERGIKHFEKIINSDGEYSYWDIYNDLTEIMEKNVSVFRTEESLTNALEHINNLQDKFEKIKIKDKGKIYNLELIEALELHSMLLVAKAITVSALNRKESRGGHYRDDYPERDDDNYLKHSEVFCDNNGREFEVKYRDVRLKPLTVESFEPKPRVY